MIDLIVAGGGPAGLVTALYAAKAGLDVVVIEPRALPTDKACGEGLMPGAVRALADLGVRPTGYPLSGIRYLDRGHRAEARFRTGTGSGLGVRRLLLQRALLDEVVARRIPLVRGHATDITQDDRSVTVGKTRARYLAAADGLHSPTRRALGLDAPRRVTDRSRWGVRRHFAIEPWSDLVEVHWADQAEAYVTPVAPDLVGVAILTGERGSWADQLVGFPELVARLPAVADSAVLGAGPLRQRSRARVAGRVLLVGDSSGYVDALTGEGIAVAISCARALVECVAADRPQQYERRWLAASRRYRWITSSLLWARRQPLVRPAIVASAQRAPRVFGAVVHQLAA